MRPANRPRRLLSRWPGCWRSKPWIVPIPGTRRQDHLTENLGALQIALTAADLRELEAAFATMTVHGLRMDEENMRAIDGWPVSTI